VKVVFVGVAVAGALIAACGMVGPTGEQVLQRPQTTVYKSADESATDSPTVTPVPQKVPGE
jgi:hypothetical protein